LKEQAADFFRALLFSELYGIELFEKDESTSYQFDANEQKGVSVWLRPVNRNEKYEAFLVEESAKYPRPTVIPSPFSFSHCVSIPSDWIEDRLQQRIKNKLKEEARAFASRINQAFVDVLVLASSNNGSSEQPASIGITDLLVWADETLSERNFNSHTLLFPRRYKSKLLAQGVIIPDDEIRVEYYVGKTKTGLLAYGIDELPDHFSVVFDSNAGVTLTRKQNFWFDPILRPFTLGICGQLELNPIVKHVDAVVPLMNVGQSLMINHGVPTQIGNEEMYVDAGRLDELRVISLPDFDLTKLIQLCEELNVCYANGSYLAVTMLTRAILDHVPPIFGFRTFNEVANNSPGRSFRNSMQHLQNSLRNIADAYLHMPIRNSETLPNKTQVNFHNDVDTLLAEIVRELKSREAGSQS
jgi:hypothetical protein